MPTKRASTPKAVREARAVGPVRAVHNRLWNSVSGLFRPQRENSLGVKTSESPETALNLDSGSKENFPPIVEKAKKFKTSHDRTKPYSTLLSFAEEATARFQRTCSGTIPLLNQKDRQRRKSKWLDEARLSVIENWVDGTLGKKFQGQLRFPVVTTAELKDKQGTPIDKIELLPRYKAPSSTPIPPRDLDLKRLEGLLELNEELEVTPKPRRKNLGEYFGSQSNLFGSLLNIKGTEIPTPQPKFEAPPQSLLSDYYGIPLNECLSPREEENSYLPLRRLKPLPYQPDPTSLASLILYMRSHCLSLPAIALKLLELDSKFLFDPANSIIPVSYHLEPTYRYEMREGIVIKNHWEMDADDFNLYWAVLREVGPGWRKTVSPRLEGGWMTEEYRKKFGRLRVLVTGVLEDYFTDKLVVKPVREEEEEDDGMEEI